MSDGETKCLVVKTALVFFKEHSSVVSLEGGTRGEILLNVENVFMLSKEEILLQVKPLSIE